MPLQDILGFKKRRESAAGVQPPPTDPSDPQTAQLAQALAGYRGLRDALQKRLQDQVPEACPDPGLATAHAAVQAARPALAADPQTADEIPEASERLNELGRKVDDYLAAEAPLLKAARLAFEAQLNALNSGQRSLPYSTSTDLEGALADLKQRYEGFPQKLDRLADLGPLQRRIEDIEQARAAFLEAQEAALGGVEARYEAGKEEVRALGWGSLPRFAPKGAEAEHAELMRLDKMSPNPYTLAGNVEAMAAMVEIHQQLKPALRTYKAKLAELLTVRRAELETARKALYEGPLREVPQKAPGPQLQAAHDRVMKARRIFESGDGDTFEDVTWGLNALAALAESVSQYRADAPQLLAQMLAAYKQARADFDTQYRPWVPDKPVNEAELKKWHKLFMSELARLPQDPKTFDDVIEGQRVLKDATESARRYHERDLVVSNWRKGMESFGPTGRHRDQLEALEHCNARQVEIFDAIWKQKLPGLKQSALSDAEMLALAEELSTWAAGLNKLQLEDEIPGLNDGIAQSETLTDDLIGLQSRGWVVKMGKPGCGTYCNRQQECIVLDPNEKDLDEVLGGIAHEVGHALFVPPEVPRMSNFDEGIDYVRQGLESAFIDEGEAQMHACKVQKEMAQSGQAYTVPAGELTFMEIYDRHLAGELSVDEARIEMGRHFNHLNASGSGQPYKEQYGIPLIDAWNDNYRRSPRRIPSYDILDQIEVFG